MDYVLIAVLAFVVSGVSLYSGFGLGTVLMPAFALFFPLELAIAATAVVHLANNLFKVLLYARQANRHVLLVFGVPALLAAMFGAQALALVSQQTQVFHYSLFWGVVSVTYLKLSLAIIIALFGFLELLPALRAWRFPPQYMVLGGLLSGFFGGFSGHQGALRSAFLVRSDLSPEAFIGTNAVISVVVDVARLLFYALSFCTLSMTVTPVTGDLLGDNGQQLLGLTAVATIAAFFGVYLSRRFLPIKTISAIQILTGVSLMAIALAMVFGLI